MGQCSDCLRPT